MRINRIIKDSRANGPGVRYTIWVQGCSIHCKGCCNKDTWNPEDGYEMSINDLIEDIKQTPVGAVTLTGGEPLDQYNEVLALLNILSPAPGLGYHILLTSGYTYKVIQERFLQIFGHVDILIDGPYIPTLADKTEKWRGSTNQGIHYLTGRANTWPNSSDSNFPWIDQKKVSAEIRIGTEGDVLITGFGIPDSIVPKPKTRYQIAKNG